MKLVVLYILFVPLVILAFTGISIVMQSALSSLNNPGPHGLTEMTYAFTSQANNNGSAFAGLNGNTDWFNITGGISMLVGRFLLMVPVLAIAGSLGRKQPTPASAGTFPTNTGLFAALLTGVVVIVVGLTYFPVVALGPIVEQLQGKFWMTTSPTLEARSRSRGAPAEGADSDRRARVRCSIPRSCGAPSSTRFVKLNPRDMMRNPVMFIVEVGSVLTTILFFQKLPSASRPTASSPASSRCGCGSPCSSRTSPKQWRRDEARRRPTRCARRGRRRSLAFAMPTARSARSRRTTCTVGDECVVPAGELIPGDGEVIEGHCVGRRVGDHGRVGAGHPRVGWRPFGRDRRDPRALRRDHRADHVEAGGDVPRPHDRVRRRRVAPEDAERDRAEHPARGPDDHLHARDRFATAVRDLLEGAADADRAHRPPCVPDPDDDRRAAFGDRYRRAWIGLVQRNVLAMSGRAVEAAGDCSTLLLDKTGTITYGNRQASQFLPVPGVDEHELADAALLSSLADETPEGRSILTFAEEHYGLVPRELPDAELVAFTAQTRMSGVDFGGNSIRKGAADSVRHWVEEQGGPVPAELATIVDGVASQGGTPLAVANGPRILGVIYLKDVVKQGMVERFDETALDGHPYRDDHG